MADISSHFGNDRGGGDYAAEQATRMFMAAKQVFETFGESPASFAVFKELLGKEPFKAMGLADTLETIERRLVDHDAAYNYKHEKDQKFKKNMLSGLPRSDYTKMFKAGVEVGGDETLAKILAALDSSDLSDAIPARPRMKPEVQFISDRQKSLRHEVDSHLSRATGAFYFIMMSTAFADVPRSHDGNAFQWVDANLENGNALVRSIWDTRRALEIFADNRQRGHSLHESATYVADYVTRQNARRPSAHEPTTPA